MLLFSKFQIAKIHKKNNITIFFVYKSVIQDNSIPALIPLQPVLSTFLIPFYPLGEQMVTKW